MKRNIVRTIFFFATLLLSLAAVASAQDDGTCSNAGVAGEWAFLGTGTIFFPTGPVPLATIGRYTRDADGNILGKVTTSRGGNVSQYTIKGTTAVNSDCTGTFTYSTYDSSGNLVNTVVNAVVWVDNEREALAVTKSFVLANGMSLPAVVTADAKKVFRDQRNQQ